jgi:hypothetical protein
MSRLLRTSLLVATAAAVTVATVPSASAAAPAGATPTTTNTAKAAAGWLAQQLVGGNHLVYSFDGKTFDGGGTADLIYALAGAGVGTSKISTVITYFEKHVETYVDIQNADGFGPNDGGIGKTALAAMVAGADPTAFGGYNLLQQLKTDECTGASATCAAPGAAANIFSSISESVVVAAEARGAAINPSYAPSADAVAYLLSLQCADGGFTSGTAGGSGCASDVDATGYAVMALQALGGHGAEIKRAGSWLMSQRNADGSWSSQGGKNIDSTGLATAALAVAGRATARSVSWLRDQQVTSGPTSGKGAERGALRYQGKFDPAASVKGTSDGILGITRSSLATLDVTGARSDLPLLALKPPHVLHASVHPGGTQRLRGTGFAAAERVVVTIHGKRLGSAVSDGNGTVHVTFTVRKSLAAGERAVVLTGHRSTLHSQATFVIRTK